MQRVHSFHHVKHLSSSDTQLMRYYSWPGFVGVRWGLKAVSINAGNYCCLYSAKIEKFFSSRGVTSVGL